MMGAILKSPAFYPSNPAKTEMFQFALQGRGSNRLFL